MYKSLETGSNEQLTFFVYRMMKYSVLRLTAYSKNHQKISIIAVICPKVY